MSNIKHKYDYDAFIKGDNSASHILKMISPKSDILEIGAGQGAITKHLVNSLSCNVSAIEIDSDSLIKLKEYCQSVYKLDLNETSWPEKIKEDEKFDTVLAADVLEHLNDPESALINMKRTIKPNGHVIVSLPHIGHNVIHACLLQSNFSYSEWGLLDKTHIRFFGIKNMQDLFDNAGLKITDVKFVLRQPEDTELANFWSKLDSKFKNLLNENKYGHVYQCVIKATPSEHISESITITELPIGNADNSIVRKVNRLTKNFLPASFYQYLRNFYQKINS